MLIRTQNKQRIVNGSHIVNIFVDKTGTKIFADVDLYDLDESRILLGEYKDRDTCLKVLDALIDSYRDMISCYQMPLGGEI